jgi:hypothetical protein
LFLVLIMTHISIHCQSFVVQLASKDLWKISHNTQVQNSPLSLQNNTNPESSPTTTPTTMQFTTTLLTLLALSAASASAATKWADKWNEDLKVYDIGLVPSKVGRPSEPVDFMGNCGDIEEGYYGCGSFGPGKIVALRAIYRCVNQRLVRAEVCGESAKYNRCIRNQRRKGRKFYPFNNGAKVVCAKRTDVEKA